MSTCPHYGKVITFHQVGPHSLCLYHIVWTQSEVLTLTQCGDVDVALTGVSTMLRWGFEHPSNCWISIHAESD